MRSQLKWVIVFSAGTTIVFCASFVLFFFFSQRVDPGAGHPSRQRRLRIEVGKPIPEGELVDLSDTRLGEDALRRGKVVLVFLIPHCEPCQREGEFLNTILNRRKDVRFYGVVSFGERQSVLQAAASEFSIKVFYDRDLRIGHSLGINQAPVKVFLKEGIVERFWEGATVEDEDKQSFIKWLDELQ
ncbi:MAG TPA: redoxin family protein [Blastocatellia bacterium]|nr:redoxin family protein [Blastocatellia bacterium]